MPRGGAERGREAGEESLRGTGVRREGGEVVGAVGRLGGSDPRVVNPVRRGTPDLYPFWGLVAVRCKLGAGINEKLPPPSPGHQVSGLGSGHKMLF